MQAGWVDVFVRDTTPGVLGAQQGGQPRYRGQLHARYKWPEIGRHGGLSVRLGLSIMGARGVGDNARLQGAGTRVTLAARKIPRETTQ